MTRRSQGNSGAAHCTVVGLGRSQTLEPDNLQTPSMRLIVVNVSAEDCELSQARVESQAVIPMITLSSENKKRARRRKQRPRGSAFFR